MPNHKSCAKRVKISEAARLRNRALRTRLRAAVKDVRNETNKEEAVKKLKTASITLDKAASYKLIHKKNASRNKSRLALFVQKLG